MSRKYFFSDLVACNYSFQDFNCFESQICECILSNLFCLNVEGSTCIHVEYKVPLLKKKNGTSNSVIFVKYLFANRPTTS